MATTEHTINDAIAELLRKTRRAWKPQGIVRSENTGMLRGSAERPDILVIEQNVSPVVIETEVSPAATVEKEAASRLGKHISTTGRIILSSIAVRVPQRLRKKDGVPLRKDLQRLQDFEMALYTGTDPNIASRWPRSGWIKGSHLDLSILAQAASVPPDVIEAAADLLVTSVSEAAGLLAEMAAHHPGASRQIGEKLRQEDGEQTRRMAAAILTNAFVFQETLAGGADELAAVQTLAALRNAGLSKATILDEWRTILRVNYWPIFDIARRILELVPAAHSRALIECLVSAADRLLENRLMRSHDLTGAVFQRLIADRKFLAAYYTTPAAAALMMGLVLNSEKPPGGGSWGNPCDVMELRIADFACGTGTLLSSAYQRIGQLHEIAGGDAASLHAPMMAHSLIGCDVLPAAAHLTASMLSGAHPNVKYRQGSILTVEYGKQPDGSIALGSLDLLDPQRQFTITDITARAAGGMGEIEQETWSTLPHASFDLVIMNPPFTRATGHHEIKKIGVPNPMFAAFNSTEEEQKLMSAATKKLTLHTSAHGNAGEASIFLVLADRKLKDAGGLGLIMPLSLMSGDAWDDSRILLRKNFSNLMVLSISGVDGSDLSFSADTDMGECMIVGRKDTNGSERAVFVVLKERPASTLLGASAALQIRQLAEDRNIRSIEVGPIGGTSIYFGDDEIGQAISAPLPTSGSWNLARIADLALAQTAYQLGEKNRLWLPGTTEADSVSLPMAKVAAIGEIGPVDRDINGDGTGGAIRGPFVIKDVKDGGAPTYPVLWSHEAERERTMAFPGDSEGTPRSGTTPEEQDTINAKVTAIQNTSSHCHLNRDFRFNSQSTSMQFTPRRTIGGRAWLSIRLASSDQEKALVLWANTSLGLLLHWFHANKQQSGRGSIPRTHLRSMAVLDVSKLTTAQMTAAIALFDEMSDERLLPLHKIDADLIRRKLDEKFLGDVLGLTAAVYASGGPIDLLRMKLAKEPSILGQK